MILPLYLNVVTISKDFKSAFLIFFQNSPLHPYYRDHQFCHFSTAKIPSWYMAFFRKMVFQRKSNASPINLWNKILGQFKLEVFTTENIYGTRVTYDLWTCSCIDESENLDSIWNSGAKSPLFRQFKHQIWFLILQWRLFRRKSNFTVRKWAMNFLTTTLPFRAYLFNFVLFVIVIITGLPVRQTRETMFSQTVSYEFLLHGALHDTFCTSSPLPLKNPQGVANLKKAICVVRSDSIMGVTL